MNQILSLFAALLALIVFLTPGSAKAQDELAITPSQPYPFYYVMMAPPVEGCDASLGCSTIENRTGWRLGISFPAMGQGLSQTAIVDGNDAPVGVYPHGYKRLGFVQLPNGQIVPKVQGTFYSFLEERLTGHFFRDRSSAQTVVVSIGGGQTPGDPELVFDARLKLLVRSVPGKFWITRKSNPMTIDEVQRNNLIVVPQNLYPVGDN